MSCGGDGLSVLSANDAAFLVLYCTIIHILLSRRIRFQEGISGVQIDILRFATKFAARHGFRHDLVTFIWDTVCATGWTAQVKSGGTEENESSRSRS
jgi:hypothetical protein